MSRTPPPPQTYPMYRPKAICFSLVLCPSFESADPIFRWDNGPSLSLPQGIWSFPIKTSSVLREVLPCALRIDVSFPYVLHPLVLVFYTVRLSHSLVPTCARTRFRLFPRPRLFEFPPLFRCFRGIAHTLFLYFFSSYVSVGSRASAPPGIESILSIIMLRFQYWTQFRVDFPFQFFLSPPFFRWRSFFARQKELSFFT